MGIVIYNLNIIALDLMAYLINLFAHQVSQWNYAGPKNIQVRWRLGIA